MAKIKNDVLKCSKCGGNLAFYPEGKCLKCVDCNNTTDIVCDKSYTKKNLDEADKMIVASKEWATEVKSMNCPNCGAMVVLSKFDLASVCPYCNTPMVASKEEFVGMKPDAIIPFAFGKEKANDIFRSQMKKKFFAPNKFKRNIPQSDIQGYYFPTFAFDTDAVTSYHGVLERDETHTNSKGQSVTKTYTFTIDGTHSDKFRDEEIETSQKLNQTELNSVKPYFFEKAYDYSSAFVAGYPVECYSTNLNDSWKVAEDEFKVIIKQNILNGYTYSRVKSFSMTTKFTNQKYIYAMLPMYRFNYKYKNKTYSNVLNGQSGKVGGKTPKSAIKITFTVLLILAIFLVPILLIALNG